MRIHMYRKQMYIFPYQLSNLGVAVVTKYRIYTACRYTRVRRDPLERVHISRIRLGLTGRFRMQYNGRHCCGWA